MLKVLLLGPFYNPLIRRLREELIRNGVNVISASFNIEDDLTNNIYSLGSLRGMYSFFYSRKLKKIISDNKPDLIHAHVSNHYGLLTLTMKRRIPVIITLWGSDVMQATINKSLLKNIVLRFFNALVYLRSSLIHSSSQHVVDTLLHQVGFLSKFKRKYREHYWGMPLALLSQAEKKIINDKLTKEFNFQASVDSKFIVFPRGIKSIYNPELVLKLINSWSNVNRGRVIVVFKAFSDDLLWEQFIKRVTNTNCIFIGRLLSDEELSYFYSLSVAHVSVPFSDNLGGGVIEPLQMGSIPILSDIKPYRELAKNSECFILNSDRSSDLNMAINYIEEKAEVVKVDTHSNSPVLKIIDFYKEVLND